MTDPTYHQPVLGKLLTELLPEPKRVVDGTLGDGGHSQLFLDRGAQVLGFDRDPDAVARAGRRLTGQPIDVVLGNVYDDAAIRRISEFRPDLILLDLGVSSRQLDDDPAGFSFRPGVTLDMRMGKEGPTAAELLNQASESELAQILSEYGDLRRAKRLALEIGRRRIRQPFRTSDDLVNAIRGALGPTSGPPEFARVFQAIRIAVNDELAGLETALPRLRDALVPGGALAVISYHSGEDRIVKNAFREWSRACVCPPELPICQCRGRPLGRSVSTRPLEPSPDEVAANARARSAKLRIFRVSADGEAR